MSLSYFYIQQLDPSQKEIVLDEDTSYHIVQVLRMKPEEKLQLTDGKGNLVAGHIVECHKKHCTIQVEETSYRQPAIKKISIAISLIKNTSRFEWFLEKATEIGVTAIIPLICERTIREKFRYDRMKGICISAMLQSQQTWLPVLHEPIAYELFFRQEEIAGISQKFIAHCDEGSKQVLDHQQINRSADQLICIGPEGDFSPKEIELALQQHFIPVSLGETRLRTETAGVVAATLLALC
ncbi:MAG TPA: RsmE family RNA methyltransferase [Chitinophagaceae bacterium]